MQTQMFPKTEADPSEIKKREKRKATGWKTNPVEVLLHTKSSDPFYVLSRKKSQFGVHVTGMFRGKVVTMRRTLFKKTPAATLFNWRPQKEAV